MMKENEYGGVHLVVSVDCGGRTPFCAAARGAVCGGVKEKKKTGKRKVGVGQWEWQGLSDRLLATELARAN